MQVNRKEMGKGGKVRDKIEDGQLREKKGFQKIDRVGGDRKKPALTWTGGEKTVGN